MEEVKNFIFEHLNLYVWAKDRNFRYTFCNENYARVAGLDSPHQIVNKKDEDLPWRVQADHFRSVNQQVFDGHARINVPEVEIMIDKVADLLVTESQLLKNNGECIGLIGSAVDITGQRLEKKTGYFDPQHGRYYLGETFDNIYLTWREVEIMKRILLGETSKQAGKNLGISPKTVESHIDNIKIKLQSPSKGDIIATAIQFGLTQLIDLNWDAGFITNYNVGA